MDDSAQGASARWWLCPITFGREIMVSVCRWQAQDVSCLPDTRHNRHGGCVMARSAKWFFLLSFLFLAAGCGIVPNTFTINMQAPTQANINDVVQATLQALTAQAPAMPSLTPSVEPASSTGRISGHLSYPADSLPAMYVTAYLVGSQAYSYVITSPGQDTFEIDGLAPGTYHVIA